MSKQEFITNGGFSGMVYDQRWPILLVGSNVASFVLGKYGGTWIEAHREAGEKRKAFYFVQALREQGAFGPTLGQAYAQPTQLAQVQPQLALALQGAQPAPVAEDKTFRIVQEIEGMLKNYGERIARLEGKTETKSQGSS